MDGREHNFDGFLYFDAGASAELNGTNDEYTHGPDVPYDTQTSFDYTHPVRDETLGGDVDIVLPGHHPAASAVPTESATAGYDGMIEGPSPDTAQADQSGAAVTETDEHDRLAAANFATLDDAIRTAVATSHDTTLPEGKGQPFTYEQPLTEEGLPPHVRRLFGKVSVAPDTEAVTYLEWREAGDERSGMLESGNEPNSGRLTSLHFMREETGPVSTTSVNLLYTAQRRRVTDDTGPPTDTHRGARSMLVETRDNQGRIMPDGASEQNEVIGNDPELVRQDNLQPDELNELVTHLQDTPRPEVNYTTPAILQDLVGFHDAVLQATGTPDVALAGRLIPNALEQALPTGADLPRPVQDLFNSVPPFGDAANVSYLQRLSSEQGPGSSEISNLVLARREIMPDGAIREVQVKYTLDHSPGAAHWNITPRHSLTRTTHVVTAPFDPDRYTTAPLTADENSYIDIAHGTVNRRPWMRLVSRAELTEINRHVRNSV